MRARSKSAGAGMNLNAEWVMMMQSQFAVAAREFLQLYPTANILVADETNFVKEKRQRFLARAACARQCPGTVIIGLVTRPRRFCSMTAAARVKVFPAPTA